MYAVAKVGSLISQGVYSVATPFHPFGGAVDIIVVQQQDGSFRSTPWYVRFGKFQGVLKGAEKIVRIHVNGAEANFHMYLDNSGGAYFIREAESGLDSEPRVGGDGVVVQGDSRIDEGIIQKFSPHMLQSTLSDPGVWREDYAASLTSDGLDRSESDTCKFYDFQDEQSSLEVEGSVEFSSEYGSSRYDNSDIVENFVDAQGLGSEMVLVSVDGHILTAPISSIEKQATDNVELSTPQFHLGPGESAEFCEGDADFCISENAWAARSLTDLITTSSSKVKAGDGLGPDNSNALEHQPGVGNDEVDICQEQTTNDAQHLPKHKEDEESKHQEQGSNNGPRDVEIHEDGGECIHQNQRAINVENLDRDLHVCSDDEDESAGDKTLDKFKSCLKLKDLDQFSDHELQGGQEFPSSIKEESKTPHETCQKDLELSNGTEAGNSCSLQAADSGVEQRVDEFRLNEEPKIPICNLSLPPSADIGDREDKKIATGARISDSDGKYVGDDSVSEGDQAKVAQLDGAMQSISDINDLEGECCPSAIVEPKADCGERELTFSSSRFEISLCRHLLRPDMGWTAAAEAFDAHHISREEFKSSATSIIKNEKLIVRLGDKYLAWDKAAPIVLGMAAFDLDLPVEPTDAIPVQQKEKMDESDSGGASTSGRKWKLWPIPFRRTKTLEHSISNSTNEEAFLDPKTPSQEQSAERTPTSQSGTPSFDISSKSPHKKVVRTNIPNSEQIASLNLKDGQNIVTFSFFTRVLGLQQVEAHIHLWKWNARIVISDVDGTITKSDVLGQFMPLVGRDWSQSGVARLFSAIKENGYQLLFLSARAIVQAYLTKSFLFNLKQDGKTLPSGPVVISPDGLFPSLYREVIRRAPHEFKIACLEDIKALFPPDYNPFYAGFGNRDTDELSYRKIGIPKGKIFIINPKGEVAINNRIDLRSYTSLHTLVNDMFPPTSMVEQEDYNAWNYWKVPLLDIDE